MQHRPCQHYHDLIGECQRLGLIMGNVNHGVPYLLVHLFQLRAQLPFKRRVNNRQRLIKQYGVGVGTHQTAPQRNFLFIVGVQVPRLFIGLLGQTQQLQHMRHTLVSLCDRQLPVLQREGQVLRHRHSVVHHRKLKHLSDIALLSGQRGNVLVVKPHPSFTGLQQARDDIQQRSFATPRRAQQRVGAAILPLQLHRLQRVSAL